MAIPQGIIFVDQGEELGPTNSVEVNADVHNEESYEEIFIEEHEMSTEF